MPLMKILWLLLEPRMGEKQFPPGVGAELNLGCPQLWFDAPTEGMEAPWPCVLQLKTDGFSHGSSKGLSESFD